MPSHDRITAILNNDKPRLGDIGSALFKSLSTIKAGGPAGVTFGEALSAIKADRINRASSMADVLAKQKKLTAGPEIKGYAPGTALYRGEEPVGQVPFKPGLSFEQQLELKSAGRSTTDIDLAVTAGGSEKEQMKIIGGGFGKQYNTLQADGASAQASTLPKIRRFRSLTQNVRQGRLQPTIKVAKQLARDLGIAKEFTADVGYAEAVTSLTTDFAMEQVERTKGAISDREMGMFLQMMPSLALTPEGNELILDLMEELAKRQVDVARMARDYRPGAGIDEGFLEALAVYYEQNPLFSGVLGRRVDEALENPNVSELPAGSTYVGENAKGYPVYDLLDGRRVVITPP